jgi:hypothetical protein
MKAKIIKLFTSAVVIIAFSASTFAQVTGSATATATIVEPIAITKNVDMNFGNLAVSQTVAGTLVLTPASGRTGNLGVTLMPGGTVAAAQFTVSGLGGATYAITLPSTDYIITRAAGSFMEVNTFTSNPAAAGLLSAGATGTQVLTVGATLNVDAAEVAGVYTNATGFDVIVNYN